MSIFIDRWLISKPADAPDKDGNTVLISKKIIWSSRNLGMGIEC